MRHASHHLAGIHIYFWKNKNYSTVVCFRLNAKEVRGAQRVNVKPYFVIVPYAHALSLHILVNPTGSWMSTLVKSKIITVHHISGATLFGAATGINGYKSPRKCGRTCRNAFVARDSGYAFYKFRYLVGSDLQGIWDALSPTSPMRDMMLGNHGM